MDSCKEMVDLCQEVADSSRALADSYKSLKTIASDLLSSWERFKVQQAAATSSPLTITTTPPPTAPLPAPATPGTDAPTNIESAMDLSLQLSVVPELTMSTLATCSMKCRDVLPKQSEATSTALAGTDVFTPVQEPAVLPETTPPSTLVDIHKSCSHTERPGVPLTTIMVSSLRVPPRPPDRRCTSQEQGASLPPSAPLSAIRKEPRCSWLRPLPTRPPDQCKHGVLLVPSRPPDQTHSTIFAFGQLTLASKPRYEKGGFSEIFVERVYVMGSYLVKIAACLIYAEIMQCIASSRELLVANHNKLNDMVLCWMPKEESCICARISVHQSGDVSRVRLNMRRPFVHEILCIKLQELQLTSDQINVSLMVMPDTQASDVNGLEFSIYNSEVNSFLSTRPRNHLHGYATAIHPRVISNNCQQHLMVRSFSISWFSCYEILQFGQLQVAMAAMGAFPLIIECTQHVFSYSGGLVDHHPWPPSLQAVGILIGIPYYPGNTIGVCSSACRANGVQQYMTSYHLYTWAPYTTHHGTTPSLVQLENLFGGSHQTAVEVGSTTGKYFGTLELYVKPKVEINGVTILWVELHVYSTCVWFSFPWNPGLHTWLWCCCCRMHDRQVPNSICGCDLVDQSCGGSSWQVEAWTHVFLYIKYDAEGVNQLAEEMLLHLWISFTDNSMIGNICLEFYYLQHYVYLARVLCLVHAYHFFNIDRKTWDPGGIYRIYLQQSLYIELKQVNYDKDLGNSSPYVQTCSLTISQLKYVPWPSMFFFLGDLGEQEQSNGFLRDSICLGSSRNSRRGECHVLGPCHISGPAQVDQVDCIGVEAQLIESDLNLGLSSVLGDVPMYCRVEEVSGRKDEL